MVEAPPASNKQSSRCTDPPATPKNRVLAPVEEHTVLFARRNVNLLINVGIFPADAHMSKVSRLEPNPLDADGSEGKDSVEDEPKRRTQRFELAPIKSTFLPNRKTDGRKLFPSSSSAELI